MKMTPLDKKIHPAKAIAKKKVFVNPNEVNSLKAYDAAQQAMEKKPRRTVANRGRVIRR